MSIKQKLKWLILSGVTETIGETPINRLKKQASEVASKPVEKKEQGDIALTQAQELARSAQTVAELYQFRADFDGCALKKTAAHTLNGYGAEQPDVLCLIEAPDTEDEKKGRLMSGAAGDLLGKMLAAIGLNLNQNAYVSGLIPWRPPGNRQPTQAEQLLCRPFWEREIELLKPKVILLFGSSVSQAVLDISALSKARGTWHDYQGIPVRVSFPPALLLKQPAQKKQAWDDLQQIQAKLADLSEKHPT